MEKEMKLFGFKSIGIGKDDSLYTLDTGKNYSYKRQKYTRLYWTNGEMLNLIKVFRMFSLDLIKILILQNY